jgi:hypothetical protein
LLILLIASIPIPNELEIKDTTDTAMPASYFDIHLAIYSEGLFKTKLYDKRYDLNFRIVNFPFICNNISLAHAKWLYNSQFILCSRACGSYHDFLDRGLLLRRKLLNPGFIVAKLKWSRGNVYGRHYDLLTVTEYYMRHKWPRMCHKWPRMCPVCCSHNPVLSSFVTYHWFCKKEPHDGYL